MKEFRKRFWYEVALCASFLPFLYSPIAYTVDFGEDLIAVNTPSNPTSEKDTYTINFNSVSIIEFIRFASKITNLNFVFEEGDLQFTVTIVSEEPISSKSVMSALSQVLRMHDLTLLEEDGNVLITKSKNVNQIPPIVSPDTPGLQAGNAALITRVFRIKNANPNTLANILRPMTSSGAMIEVSLETRQLIVTDITTNVDQIASLLVTLDTPHTSLEIDSYVVKNVPPQDLITLTQQILNPFAEGNPLIFVPQIETNSIFIVSTANLIERAIAVMEDLDIPIKPGAGSAVGKTLFIYRPTHIDTQELMNELHQVNSQMKSSGGPTTALENAIDSMQEVTDTGSLMFLATTDAITKLKEILATFDVPPSAAALASMPQAKSNFLIYNPQYRSGEELYNALNEIGKNLQDSGLANPSLLQTISTMKWVPNTNSLLFTGDPQSLERIQGMLKAMDTPTPFTTKNSQVFIYKPQYVSPDQIENALNSLIPSLEEANTPSDQNLIHAIQSMQWNDNTQSFMVTSDPATIERLQGILASIDSPQATSPQYTQGFYLYKLQSAPCDKVLSELKQIAGKLSPTTLANKNLTEAINKIECISANNSLLITGTTDAIEQIKTLIAEFDVPSGVSVPSAAQSFLIYKAKYLPAEEIQLALNDLSSDLQASGLNDPQLFQTISSMRYVESTNSLLFTGTPDTLSKVQGLISEVDNASALGQIQHIGNVTFFLYKIQSADPNKLIASLKAFAVDLKQSDVQDKQLADCINSVKWIKETNSLLFTGNSETLERVQELVKKFDLPSLQGQGGVPRAAATFVIYNPKYLSGDDLISILCDFMQNLVNSGVSDPGLYDAINTLKWIPKTSSLLISGDPQSVEKVQQLLLRFDQPGKESTAPSIESIDNTSFLVYKLQYHPGNDIQTALKQVAVSLGKGTSPPVALVEAINSLQWITVTNSLLCTGQQDVLVKMKDLIQNLDVPLRQVFIEVLVISTSLTNTQNFGLMWGAQAQYFNKATLGTGNFPVPQTNQSQTTPVQVFGPTLQGINATTTPAGGITNQQVPFATTTGFDMGVIGDIIMNKGQSFLSLGALVNALQLDNDSTIILNPKIITQDNRQSTIFVGSNVPYTGAIVTNTASNTTSTANIEYRDVGVSLTITPILGDNDIITMDVVQDISQVTSGSTNTSTTQLTGIQTSHTHMETRVHIPNNFFVALSGMVNDSKTHYKTGIPCLGGLPVIGLLFSETDRTAVKQNVIMFIRPHIINSYAEYKSITEHQEWLFKDNARLPMLKEEFDEGIDMVKTPENE